MKLSELVRQVNRDIDDDYEFADIKDWVNRCLDDLTPIAKRKASSVLENPYTLPDNLHELRFVSQNNQFLKKLSMDDTYSYGYKQWGTELLLQNADSSPLTIYYYRKLDHVEKVDEEPELEPEFHDLLLLYCLGNMQFTEEDYDERPDSFLRYNQRKQEYILFINKKNRQKRVSEKVIW